MKQQNHYLDKFYTNPETAELCFNKIYEYIKEIPNSLIIEPSAGNGVFIELFKKYNLDFLALDIKPEHSEICEMDFFDFHFPEDKNIITIGNPPFGKNSSLAKKFFNRCIENSEFVGFILPKTFKKEIFQNNLNLKCKLIDQIDLNKYSFLYENKKYDVPCCFQIWKRELFERKIHNIFNLECFVKQIQFLKEWNSDCISFQRVGGGAGKISFEMKNKESHYYIQTSKNIIEFLEKEKWIQIKFNTAGNPSIGKNEILKLLIDNNLIINNKLDDYF